MEQVDLWCDGKKIDVSGTAVAASRACSVSLLVFCNEVDSAGVFCKTVVTHVKLVSTCMPQLVSNCVLTILMHATHHVS